MQCMDVGELRHLAHRRLGTHDEGGTGRGPREMVYAEGPHRGGKTLANIN
jgi:hypothetical protein